MQWAAHLPDGLSEVYLHPGAGRSPLLRRLMPGYEHEAELAALLDAGVRRAFDGVVRTTYGG